MDMAVVVPAASAAPNAAAAADQQQALHPSLEQVRCVAAGCGGWMVAGKGALPVACHLS